MKLKTILDLQRDQQKEQIEKEFLRDYGISIEIDSLERLDSTLQAKSSVWRLRSSGSGIKYSGNCSDGIRRTGIICPTLVPTKEDDVQKESR